ncbi:HEAT repeat domain-containing protein, partial [Limnospira indica]
KIGVGNPQVIAGLVQVIQNTRNKNTRREAAESLEKIGVGN